MVLCVQASACSLLVSLDGLPGPAPVSALAADAEVGTDATRGPEDAGGDVADAADTSISPCLVRNDFCDDFDGQLALGALWTNVVTSSNVEAAYDEMSRSSPRSFLARVFPTTVRANILLLHDQPIPSVTATTRVEVDVLLTRLTLATPTLLIGIERNDRDWDNGVYIESGPTGPLVHVKGNLDESVPLNVSAGTWFHLRVDAVIHPTLGRYEVWVDGVAGPAKRNIATSTFSGLRRVLVGLRVASASNETTVRYDNVAINAFE